MREFGAAALFTALVFAVSFPIWLAAVASLVFRADGGGARIFYASGILAGITGLMFGRSFWRHRRNGEGPYWEKIFQRR